MDYSSADRQQLLDRIKDRDNKIERYEKRLTDVVVAFKNLQKEKAALEETLRQVDFASASRKNRLQSPRKEAADVGGAVTADSSNESEGESASAAGISSESAEAYEARIAKLLDSVNALTQQKNELAATYQTDKRKLREEFEHTIADQKRDLESCAIVRRDLEAQLNELRSRARQQAKSEQDTGALCARLAAETGAREAAESQLADLRLQLSDANRAAANQEVAHRKALTQLERAMESRLAEAAASTGERETRADELEARVAQLAASLGEAERRRQADARSAGRLRERLECLDCENRQLRFQLQNTASAATAAAAASSDGGGGGAHPVAVVEPVQRRSLAQQMSTESGKSDDASSYSFHDSSTALDGDDSAVAVDLHAACQEQVRQLRAELDTCRLRLLTAPPTPPPSATQPPTFQQQSELQRVQRDLRACRERCQALETEAARREQGHQERQASAERRHRDETARLRRELTARALEAEAELARHRDRTLRLVADKDAELKEARLAKANRRTAPSGGGGAVQDSGEVDEALLLSHMRSGAAACTTVHAQLEGAVAQADLAALRDARRQAEHRLRSLQAELAEQRQVIADLRVELARCQQPTQESAEYVRNLVYHYLTLSDDCRTKKTVLTAMCTVLNFSDTERHKALQKQFPASWW